MSTLLQLHTPEEATDLAAAMLSACHDRRVFVFQGELGAGKTTLIKAMCAELGVASGTSSPSFSIVNEYRTATNQPVYHFDLYRLKNEQELDGIGFTEYLDSGNYCFVEWPELAKKHLPAGAVTVRMRVNENGDRTIEVSL
ncbi:MAG: tRNA (adenosine(37)-N6)-threonylcarbamoyltransferase complex ATPase subunit type 1 TsaE [Flavobacteriales bacterium]|nr:tRNA (adenosine(37)-N6)-threonylcarbamoyltransferase complex ATPase subunit type 1 TsaE [Flavobacteriales bacterium]